METLTVPDNVRTLINDRYKLNLAKEMQVQLFEEINGELKQIESSYNFLDRTFSFLGSRKRKDSEMTELKKQLRVEKRFLTKIITKAKNLKDRIDLEIGMILSDSDEEYQESESIKANYIDIHSSFENVKSKVENLSRLIGSARNTMTSDYDQKNKTFSDTAQHEMDRAFRAAEALQDEEQIYNSIAERHSASVRGTRYHAITIPRLNLKSYYREIIQQQEGSSIADIQQTFDNLLNSLDTLCNEDFKAIENELNSADKNHASVTNGYVREVMKTVDFSN